MGFFSIFIILVKIIYVFVFFTIKFRAEVFLNPASEGKQENEDEKEKSENEEKKVRARKMEENKKNNDLYHVDKKVEESEKEVEFDNAVSSIDRETISKGEYKDQKSKTGKMEDDENDEERNHGNAREEKMENREEKEANDETRERDGRKRGREESANMGGFSGEAAAGEFSREADAYRPNEKSSSVFNKTKKRTYCVKKLKYLPSALLSRSFDFLICHELIFLFHEFF